jgi:hypothetical protein
MIASTATRLAVAPSGDAHRVTDRAAAELEHRVLAEQVEQQMHLSRRGCRPLATGITLRRHRRPVLLEVEADATGSCLV